MDGIDCKVWGGQAKRSGGNTSSPPPPDDGHNQAAAGSSASKKQVLKKGMFDDKACEVFNKKTSESGYVAGTPIAKLQQQLIDMGFLKQEKPDGDFGEKTEQALKDFQAASLKNDRLCKNCTDLTKAPSITYTGTSDGIYGEHSDSEMTLWTNKNWIKPVKSFKKGDSGPELQNFQTTLQDIGVYIDRAVDGWFWNKMLNAVNQFQEAAEKGKFVINGVLTDIEKLTGHRKGDLCPKTQDHLKMVKDKGGKVPQSVTDLCEKHWEAHKDDCSGFVKAVATDLNVTLTGQANDIVDQIQKSPWKILKDGKEADSEARAGKFVVAGLKDDPNGHVVIIVPGELAHDKYPTGYWGHLGGVGYKNTTINYSWKSTERDKVIYASIQT
jgi:peptidoglycan hydrolase-like protein with peptidoglycan-binding domain